jgi:hypothetical protein
MSALGHPDIYTAIGHVRFTPKSGHLWTSRSVATALRCGSFREPGTVEPSELKLESRVLTGRIQHLSG